MMNQIESVLFVYYSHLLYKKNQPSIQIYRRIDVQ